MTRHRDQPHDIRGEITIPLTVDEWAQWAGAEAPLFSATITHTVDPDPAHRKPRNLRELLRQMLDIINYERRAARDHKRPTTTVLTFTLPKVTFK